ncbi:hypothetical protein N185_10680 [Sinorhizobium sp. GW3]|nr:hypothetical protein N185_10680 [Sinorhizobium sp. GW3]
MTIDEAAKNLREMYQDPTYGKVTAVHLFGIRFANALDGMPLKDVAVRAGIAESYHAEIRKGISLARFVVER